MNLKCFETREDMFEAVRLQVVAELNSALASKDRASILLSGGSTPAPLYAALSAADLDWSRLDIGLVDDRWVSPDDDASNEKLVKESMLLGQSSKSSFYSMKSDDQRPTDAVPAVDARYRRFRRPDVVILGMGADGHTASWFPGSKGLQEAMDPEGSRIVAAIDASGCPVAGKNTRRMTVTLPPIRDAGTAILIITGEEKRKVFEDKVAKLPIHVLDRLTDGALVKVWAP